MRLPNYPDLPIIRLSLVLALTALFSAPQNQAVAQPNQATILTGVVTDATTGLPLPGANVFVASSMIGTTTNSEGRYRLERVPTGTLRLYVSMLGYEPAFQDLLLRTARVYKFDFSLAEKILDLGGVTVEAERDEKWAERLKRFTSLFIGESPNSSEVTIVNPEVLDFAESGGSLTAVAAGPIEIENKALGYTIQYFLADFRAEPMRTQYDGEPLYTELQPSSPEEAEQWRLKRNEAFMGSFRHFLLSLISDRVEGQGFKTYSRPGMNRSPGGTFEGSSGGGNSRFPIDSQKLFVPGETASEFTLNFQGYIEIAYMGEVEHPSYAEWSGAYGRRGERFQTSWVVMEHGPTTIDYKGDILDPYGVTFSGYLAFERVADEVPKEYRPR
jgi:CarboxypepD_reg-like domain